MEVGEIRKVMEGMEIREVREVRKVREVMEVREVRPSMSEQAKEFSYLIRREWQQARGDMRRLVFLFGAAMAYIVVFGMLYMPNIVRYVPTVVYDAAQTARSREILQAFADSDSFRIAAYASSEEEMRRYIMEKEAYVAIGIPADFSRRWAQDGSATVLYMVNGSNIILTNVTSSAAQDILADISNRWGAERTALALGADQNALAGRIAPVSAGLRVLGNPTQGYLFFFLIGLAMAAFQQGIIFAVGASILHEKEQRERGISFRKLLAVKAVFYWCLAMLSYLLILSAVRFGLGIHLQAPVWEPLLLGAAYSFCMVLFTSFVASFFQREVQFVRASIMYPVPAFILSGYAWPTEAMGQGMQVLAKLFPMSYLSNNVREFFLLGMAPDYWHSMAVLLAMGTVCGILAAFLYKPRRRAA